MKVDALREMYKKEEEEDIVDDEEDDEDEDEALIEAVGLLHDVEQFLDYIFDPKLVQSLSWEDRKEIRRYLKDIRNITEDYDFDDEVTEEDVKGDECNLYPQSSCIQKMADRSFWCKECVNKAKRLKEELL